MDDCPSPMLDAPSFSLADASLAAFLAEAAAAASRLQGRGRSRCRSVQVRTKAVHQRGGSRRRHSP